VGNFQTLILVVLLALNLMVNFQTLFSVTILTSNLMVEIWANIELKLDVPKTQVFEFVALHKVLNP
jgi:hypothetical protein